MAPGQEERRAPDAASTAGDDAESTTAALIANLSLRGCGGGGGGEGSPVDASQTAHIVGEQGKERADRGHEDNRAPGATSDAAGDATSAAAPAADTSGGASAALMDSLCSLVGRCKLTVSNPT